MAREPSNVSTTDAELLGRSFTTSDPESLADLILTVPESKEQPIIEFSYDLTPPEGFAAKRAKVRCVHCKYPNHWKGYVMRAAEGQRFLVGKDCGAKLYGAKFGTVEQFFNRERQRQQYLKRLAAARVAFPQCLQAVVTIKEHSALSSYLDCRNDLHQRMRPLWSQLVAIATRGNGTLTVVERVRDYAAELRRAEKQKSSKTEPDGLTLTRRKALKKAGLLSKDDDKPIYQEVESAIGQLAGKTLFQAAQNPMEVVAQSHQRLQRVFMEIVETPSDDIPSKRLGLLVRELNEAMSDIDREMDKLAALSAFFDLRNLTVVCTWASKREACDGAYKINGRGIEWKTVYGDIVTVQPPSGYEVPRPEGLEVFKLALTQ